MTIDGVDLRELNVEAIRRNVAFVFQEPAIFDDSVRGNVSLGRPEASEEDVEAALATAGALDFVQSLPDGLDSRLGRNGATLSVGQKQRVAIARGLISEAPILILDEPTAALDPETEVTLVDALQHERDRRVLIVIAHRLSTIRSANRIVFLEDGRVVESGSHVELLANPDGAYRRFIELQVGSVT